MLILGALLMVGVAIGLVLGWVLASERALTEASPEADGPTLNTRGPGA